MTDSIKIVFTQNAKTVLGPGRAESLAWYFVAGYSMESLLADEARFKADMKKCINHMISNQTTNVTGNDEIELYECDELDAIGKSIMRVSADADGLYYVDFTAPVREKTRMEKKAILDRLATIYRDTLLRADRERRDIA